MPTVWPPAGRGWAGEGPADGGPLLLGVIISLVSSSPSCLLELAKLLWLLVMSCPYALCLDPPVYIWVGGPDVEESIVLVRLPLMAARDMEEKAFGVSGGEKGACCSNCSIGGEAGVFGRGFSRLRLLMLLPCLTS